MPRYPRLSRLTRAEDGFTLIELLVATLIGTIITGAALSFLIFANEDASHITERVTVDQTARTAMQRIISELHSACVAPTVVPILAGSTASTIDFVSQAGEQSTLSPVERHEIVFTEPKGSVEGTLTENDYKSTGGTAPNYTWATTPTKTALLKGIRKTAYKGEETPVFRYYRYYRESDAVPSGHTKVPYGELYPLAFETVNSALSPYIVKVTVAFTVAPEGKEGISFNHDRPVPLEDSAVFRMAAASEEASNTNLPCTDE